MNYARVLSASVCAFIAYFIYGGILFGLLPWLRTEFAKYPAVYRSQEGIKSVMPFGMLAMFVALVAIAILYAMIDSGGSSVVEGARFGALIGVYLVEFGKILISEAWPFVWTMILGALFITVVLFLPEGIVGLLKKSSQFVLKRLGWAKPSA